MTCQQCGAPMTPVRDRDYFFCDSCGGFYFPSPSQDGVRILDNPLDGLACPVCQEPLARAAIDHWQAYHCLNCQGLLAQQGSFRTIIKYRRARAPGPPEPPRALDLSEMDRRLACPRCHEAMDTHPYYGPGNIVIDTCPYCQLIWLDYGELAKVVAAPGRDRVDGAGYPWVRKGTVGDDD